VDIAFSGEAIACIVPFADVDLDGDADQDDFARLQICMTDSLPPSPLCACLERSGDGAIGEEDIEVFLGCLSGPGLPVPGDCDN
jgi:hypothetical protein